MNEQEEKVSQPEYDYSILSQWIEDAYLAAGDNAVTAVQARIQFDCVRCRESWSCPSLTPEQRRDVADLVRRKLMFEPLEYFRLAGFTFVAAKRTMHHIMSVQGKCHKCSRELPDDSEQIVCRCRSLNLNWWRAV
jgi:hypothetical protein